MLFAPLLGVTLLPKSMKHSHDHGSGHQPGWFGKMFERLLVLAMRWKWTTILLTVLFFGASVYGMKFVQQQFFPNSDRNELIVDWTLRQNASITRTQEELDRFEKILVDDPDVVHWSSYVGQGAVRFLLSFDVQPPSPNFGQVVIVTKDIEARDRLRAKLEQHIATEFPGTDAFVHLLDIGPPVGRPVQYRVSGPDMLKVRSLSQDLAAKVGENQYVKSVVYDWNEPGRVIKIDVLQDKAAQLGITSQSIAQMLNSIVGGTSFTQIRDHIYLVNVIAALWIANALRSRRCRICKSPIRTVKPFRWLPSRTFVMRLNNRLCGVVRVYLR